MKLYQIITEGWKQKQLANLTRKSIERVRDAGMLPSAKAYADGLNRGTDEIAKKAGAKLGTKMGIRKAHNLLKITSLPHVGTGKPNQTTTYRFLPKNPDHTRALAKPFRKSKHEFSKDGIQAFQAKGNKHILDAVFRRHEADEMSQLGKIIAPTKKTTQYDKAINSAVGYRQMVGAVSSGKASSHLPGVLAKEKKINDLTKKVYGSGVYRTPEELKLGNNTTNPVEVKQLIKQWQKLPNTLTPAQKTQIATMIDTQAPSMVKKIVRKQSRPGKIIPRYR